VERIGVERARRAVADADVVIAVLDATAGLTAEDAAFFVSLGGRAAIAAVNKADAADPAPMLSALSDLSPLPAVAVSAATGGGLVELRAAVVRVVGAADIDAGAPLVTSVRHAEALRDAAQALAHARETLAAGLPTELVAVDAHGALSALGVITGETAREEVIAGIFARFCIGK
jgi:tRNA modification GTPase